MTKNISKSLDIGRTQIKCFGEDSAALKQE